MSLTFFLLLYCFWCGSSADDGGFTSLVGIGEPNERTTLMGGFIKASHPPKVIRDEFFVQELDHFNPNDNRKWLQVLICLILYDTLYNDSIY